MWARWWRGCPAPRACTPAGIIELLKRGGIPIAGQRAVVVGRSDIVGKPAAMLLLHEHATVTICHSKTPDLPAVCREADILVAAIGRAAMITRRLHPRRAPRSSTSAPITSRTANWRRGFSATRAEKLASFDQKGSVLVGDVDPIDVVERAGAYTPVPGGVGPLTIAMLMVNTVASAERRARAYAEGRADGRHRLRKVVRRRGAGRLRLPADPRRRTGACGAGARRRGVRGGGAGIRPRDSDERRRTSTGAPWRRGCSATRSAWRD